MTPYVTVCPIDVKVPQNMLRTRRGIHVRPYPWPLGNDGKLPLLSSNADTFHAANAHRGTILRDNYFVNAGDSLPH